ncbi:cupin domain-containing protein [Catalinimonas sp. 4WD22]|uniref:cupin domain-containing protein n=1 Tax=Catalinimonas locisalis TaxID=3133978 RepID=UPI0031018C02
MNKETQNREHDSSQKPDSPMLSFNFPSLIRQLKHEESWAKNGRGAKTLHKTETMRIILNTMKPGTEIKPHQASGPISVHVLEGQIKFSTEKEARILHQGEMLTLEQHIRHSVDAIEETSFLLTVSLPKSPHS